MNKPTAKGAAKAPDLFALPDLPSLPDLPDIDDITDNLPDIDAMMAEPPPNPLSKYEHQFNGNIEHDSQVDDDGIAKEFTEADAAHAAIRAGRQQQQEAVALANDTSYWFAMFFQSQAQKDAFLKAMKWYEHGDKYIDGRFAARKQGIELPPRPAPYKVGRIDKKLSDLT